MSEYDWSHAMSKLQLTQELDTEHYQAFLMAEPGTRCGSMRIIFTPEGIVIGGDLVPMHNGIISNPGYGLGWFSGQLSGSYLCSKFLREEYVPEIAEAYLFEVASSLADSQEFADDYGYSPDDMEELAELKKRLEYRELSEYEFYEAMYRIDPDAVADAVGHGYNLRDASLLCAIQRRFAELYAEFRPVEA